MKKPKKKDKKRLDTLEFNASTSPSQSHENLRRSKRNSTKSARASQGMPQLTVTDTTEAQVAPLAALGVIAAQHDALSSPDAS